METIACIIIGILVVILIPILFKSKLPPIRASYGLGNHRPDEAVLKLQQDSEDRRHYLSYESQYLYDKRIFIADQYERTMRAIASVPGIEKCITPEALEETAEKYAAYYDLCNKVTAAGALLTKEEFVIAEKNPILCTSFNMRNPCGAIYNIYHEPTAKYAKGNVIDQIKKEFKEKWGFA